jgi:hypothetical protein
MSPTQGIRTDRILVCLKEARKSAKRATESVVGLLVNPAAKDVCLDLVSLLSDCRGAEIDLEEAIEVARAGGGE